MARTFPRQVARSIAYGALYALGLIIPQAAVVVGRWRGTCGKRSGLLGRNRAARSGARVRRRWNGREEPEAFNDLNQTSFTDSTVAGEAAGYGPLAPDCRHG